MIPTPKYMNRKAAAEFVRAQGIKLTEQALADLAYDRKGPRFARVNGKVVYTADWLLAWIESEVSRPVERNPRRRRPNQQQSAA